MASISKRIGDHKEVIITSVISSVITALVVIGIVFSVRHNPQTTPVSAANSTSTFQTTGEETNVVEAVQKANPSVVSIVISKDVPIIEQYRQNVGPFSFSVPQQNGEQQVEVGGGSGFIVSSDGLVITNKHVVDDPNASYTLFTNDGKKYDVKVVATDPFYDIAVLKIQGGGTFPYLQFGNSDNLELGQTAIAIGNALAEFRNSVSVGVISGLSREITAGSDMGGVETLDQAIQTDAAINPGNSGGPLLNTAGQVIGVDVALVEGSENIGFALPGNIAKTALESVEKTGTIVRPYLGVRTLTITPDVEQQYGLSIDHGELVTKGQGANEPAVLPNSSAAEAGIKENDVILEVDGQAVDENHPLGELIRDKNVGDAVTITLERGGKQMTVQATLEQAPANIQ